MLNPVPNLSLFLSTLPITDLLQNREGGRHMRAQLRITLHAVLHIFYIRIFAVCTSSADVLSEHEISAIFVQRANVITQYFGLNSAAIFAYRYLFIQLIRYHHYL